MGKTLLSSVLSAWDYEEVNSEQNTRQGDRQLNKQDIIETWKKRYWNIEQNFGSFYVLGKVSYFRRRRTIVL